MGVHVDCDCLTEWSENCSQVFAENCFYCQCESSEELQDTCETRNNQLSIRPNYLLILQSFIVASWLVIKDSKLSKLVGTTSLK